MFSLTVLISYFLIYFFVPIRGHTKHGKECLIYQSVRDPNVGYVFLRRSRNGDVRRTVNGNIAYVCGGCPRRQQIPPIRPQLQNPNLLRNPFNEAQQQQIFMNPQIQMLMIQQQQQQQIAYQQQMAYFQWQQMNAQNRFRFP